MTPEAALARGERHAALTLLSLLRRHLGVARAALLLGRLLAHKARGEPFAHLGKPTDQRDRLSRRQCADVILLDRLLTPALGPEQTRAILRQIVVEGGVRFLDQMVPDLSPEQLRDQASSLAGRFFNAEGTVRAGDDGVSFDVSRCRFVELTRAADASHLAPLFCEVDASFFGQHRPIKLERTRTLASDGKPCDFRFKPP